MAAASSASFKLFCLGLLGLLVLAPHAEAVIGCGQVVNNLSPCLGYIGGGPLSSGCCPGIKRLQSQAATKPDRQAVCGCLKKLANSYKGQLGKAQGLLKTCGVNLSYPLSPSVNCATVN